MKIKTIKMHNEMVEDIEQRRGEKNFSEFVRYCIEAEKILAKLLKD